MKKIIITLFLVLAMALSLASCDVVAGEVDKLVTEATAPLVETIESLEETKTELENAKATLETAKATLEEAKTKLEAEKATLEEAKTKLEAEKAKLESEKAALEETRSALESINTENEEIIAELNACLEATETALAEAEAKEDILIECIKGNHIFDSVLFYLNIGENVHRAEFYCNNCGLDLVIKDGATCKYENDVQRYEVRNYLGISEEEYAEKVNLVMVCYGISYIGDLEFKSVTLLHQYSYNEWSGGCGCRYCSEEFHQNDGVNCVCTGCNVPFHNIDPTTGLCTICGRINATATITIDGVTEYFDSFDEIKSFAAAHDGCTVVLQNDCMLDSSNNVITEGNYTIDLNGNSMRGYNGYITTLVIEGGNITISDSKGGILERCYVEGGNVTIKGINMEFIGGYSGTLTVIDCTIEEIIAGAGGAVSLASGSFEALSTNVNHGTPDAILAEGCGYYDADGNLVDATTIQVEGYWYYLSNVTVAPIN